MQKCLIVLIVIFAITLAGVRTETKHLEREKKYPNWGAIPYTFDGWHGVEASFDPVYGSDPAETSFLRVYAKNGEPPVIVYVGFYGDLSAILDVHTPELCYPAQGWKISSVRRIQSGSFRGVPIPSKEIVVDKYGVKRLVMWWYLSGAKPIETRIRYVYAMLVLSAFTGRTDGSMVRLETPLDAGGEAAGEARIQELRASFVSSLEKALP